MAAGMKAGIMENKFSQIGVNNEVLKAINELGFEIPTDVQRESIPMVLNKKDLIVMSKTGSGKTAAFGIPILQQMDKTTHEPNALILAPTRELAVQVEKDIRAMGKYTDVRTTSVYGQHNMNTEIDVLRKGVDLVCGTPGRVYDHIKRKNLKTTHIEFLVLDEADRMLDMGFIDQVVQIIKVLPKKRVTLLFSATMPPEIKRICQSYMSEPVTIELETETKTVDTVKQIYYKVEPNEKRKQLVRFLQYHQPDSCMVFCNTRDEVDRVQRFLQNSGYWAEALHGANNQNKRMRTIERFKQGKVQVMVATDVAARGIHIEDLSLVVNYDVPEDKNSYVHRIGRTGRAGKGGLAVSIVTSETLMTLYEIEEHVGVLIDEADVPSDEEVAAAAAASDNKWMSMDPPPKAPKQESRSRDGKRDSKSGRGKGDRRHSDKRRDDRHESAGSRHKSSKPSHKKTHTHEEKTKDSNKPIDKKHTHKPDQRTSKPTTHHKVEQPVKHHKPKHKTEKKMTRMGEIEFVVKDDKKPDSLLGKVKKFFGM